MVVCVAGGGTESSFCNVWRSLHDMKLDDPFAHTRKTPRNEDIFGGSLTLAGVRKAEVAISLTLLLRQSQGLRDCEHLRRVENVTLDAPVRRCFLPRF